MDDLKTVMMRRDGLTSEEVDKMIEIARERILNDGDNLEDVLMEEFGLEPDYIFDIL